MKDITGFSDAVTREIAKVVVGQAEALRQILIGLVAGGHVLLEGPPGLAKTLLARTLARTLGASFARIQFTPDLMPNDITGVGIYRQDTRVFEFHKGPVFTDVLLADEINRTPPKTQSALLEAMEERQVTIDGETHSLPSAFFVIATQNPIEYEGTYPLPEAQVDRFLLKVLLSYPTHEEEVGVLRRFEGQWGAPDPAAMGVAQVLSPDGMVAVRARVDKVRADDAILEYATRVTDGLRRSPLVLLGPSPRGSLALLRASKVAAALDGRDFVAPDDVREMAFPCLRHRLILKPEAEVEDADADAMIRRVLEEVKVPA